MSKHEAVTTHIFTTEEGIKLVIEITDNHSPALYLQYPGSGNRPIPVIPSELKELSDITTEANKFLIENNLVKPRTEPGQIG